MKLDLSFLLQPPEFSARAMLTIDALAPLSMVTSMPGAYYRSQTEPNDEMLCGMLENALGWHCAEDYLNTEKERQQLTEKISKIIQKSQGRTSKDKIEIKQTDVGFISLLQFHLRIVNRFAPSVMHYEDYWSRQVRNNSFYKSKGYNYDLHVHRLLNAVAEKEVTIGENKEQFGTDPSLIINFKEKEKIHLEVLRPYFAQYHSKPTKREYIVPQSAYKYGVETSPELAKRIAIAIEDPAAPLYLGSNDGWVDVKWEIL